MLLVTSDISVTQHVKKCVQKLFSQEPKLDQEPEPHQNRTAPKPWFVFKFGVLVRVGG